MKNTENKKVNGGILLSFLSVMLATLCAASMFLVCSAIVTSGRSIEDIYRTHDYYKSDDAKYDACNSLKPISDAAVDYYDKDGKLLMRNKAVSNSFIKVGATVNLTDLTVQFYIKDTVMSGDSMINTGFANKAELNQDIAYVASVAPEGAVRAEIRLLRIASGFYEYTFYTVMLFACPVLFLLAVILFIIGSCRRGKREKYRLISEKISSHIFFEIKWIIMGISVAGIVMALKLAIEGLDYNMSQTFVAALSIPFFICVLVYFLKLSYYDISQYGADNYFKQTFFYWLFKSLGAGKKDEKCVKKIRVYFILYLVIAAVLCFIAIIFAGSDSNIELICVLLLLLAVTAVFVTLVMQALKDYDIFAKKLISISKGENATGIKLPQSSDMAPLDRALDTIDEGYRAASERALQDEMTKVELITNVSHDLKTPLTSIMSYTDLLAQTEDLSPQEAKDYVNVLETKTQKLKKLIDDLFELSKATTSSIEINSENIDFGTLVKQTLSYSEDAVNASGLVLDVMISDEPMPINADGARIQQVLDNLIGNALKYSLAGSRVYVRLAPEGDKAVFEIKNISAGKLDIDPSLLTERFVRGDESRTTEGSGLGLAIAKTYTELCGGEFALKIDGDLFKAAVSFVMLKPATEVQAI